MNSLRRVSIASLDVERAADWYCKVFGFQPVPPAATHDSSSVRVRFVDGAAGCATELEFVPRQGAPLLTRTYHLAFAVAGMAETCARAVELGSALIRQPVGRHGWVSDLDGLPVHVVTRSRPTRAIGWRFVGLRVADIYQSAAFYTQVLWLHADASPSTTDEMVFTRISPSNPKSARLSVQVKPGSPPPPTDGGTGLRLLLTSDTLDLAREAEDPDGYCLSFETALVGSSQWV